MLTAEIPYTLETNEKLVNETYGPNNIRRRKSGTQDARMMRIEDGRSAAEEISLERNGFVLVEHKTAMRNFFDPEELKSVYYREVEALIKACSGASRVVLFDHSKRSIHLIQKDATWLTPPQQSAVETQTKSETLPKPVSLSPSPT